MCIFRLMISFAKNLIAVTKRRRKVEIIVPEDLINQRLCPSSKELCSLPMSSPDSVALTDKLFKRIDLVQQASHA